MKAQHSGSFRNLLLPFSLLYQVALAWRELRLSRGWEPVRRLRFPVVSIGNLSTGGAGKTPFAIALSRALMARGFGVDVLSRGYGRRSGVAARVDPQGNPEDFGDEPLLIAREAGVPVYVARERFEAGRMAEAVLCESHPSGAKAQVDFVGLSGTTEVVPFQNGGSAGFFQQHGTPCPVTKREHVHILDDAFQHRQLQRDVDIVVLNREDWRDGLLPAGNLREPLNAARRADVIAIPEDEAELERELRAWGWRGPVWRVRRQMEVPRVEGPVVAFCGIARPQQFFAGLEAAGLRLADGIVFRDHYRYTARDLDRLQSAARSSGAAALITTAKDQVRIEQMLPSVGGALPVLTAELRIAIEDEAGALEWLEERLRRATAAQLPL